MAKLWIILLLSLGVALTSSPPASAQTSQKGITISPFIEQLSVNPSDTQKSFNVTLTNNTGSIQELDLSTEDFGSLNDTGGIILEGSNTYTQQYGLVSWLTLGTNTVVLNPGQSQSVSVTVNNRSSLQPGGHYGAILAKVSNFNAPPGNQVQIDQQITMLLLVNKTGGDHYALKLDSAEQNGNWLHVPNDVRLLFQNPGNVHVVPRGLVKLENPAGTVMAQGIINDESAFVLPESFRELYVPLTTISKPLALPGTYRLVVQFRYDGITNYDSVTYAVRFIDLKLYVCLLVCVLLALWLYRHYHHSQKQRPKKAGKTEAKDL